jgi:hypothetical protein
VPIPETGATVSDRKPVLLSISRVRDRPGPEPGLARRWGEGGGGRK